MTNKDYKKDDGQMTTIKDKEQIEFEILDNCREEISKLCKFFDEIHKKHEIYNDEWHPILDDIYNFLDDKGAQLTDLIESMLIFDDEDKKENQE